MSTIVCDALEPGISLEFSSEYTDDVTPTYAKSVVMVTLEDERFPAQGMSIEIDHFGAALIIATLTKEFGSAVLATAARLK